jgi:hypothetical protein
MRLAVLSAVLCSAIACSGTKGDASLVIETAARQVVNDGSALVLKVLATNPDGTVGSGSVQLTAGAGLLEPAEIVLDAFGTGTFTLTCDVSSDSNCTGTDVVTAVWRGTSAVKSISVVGPTTTTGQARLVAQGCTAVTGQRPDPTTNLDTPRVSSPAPISVAPGSTFTGTLSFTDPQHDEKTAIVQLGGEASYYTCSLSAAELAAETFALSHFALSSEYQSGTVLLYLAIQDAVGNISGYATVAITVGGGGAAAVCSGTAVAFQLAGSAPSASTAFYLATNGKLATYALTSKTGETLTIVYRSVVQIDTGSCTKLLLSSKADGTRSVGWDNCLLLEARASAGQAPVAVWAYCSPDTPDLFDTGSGAKIARPLMPTVAGNSLIPPVPSNVPFGFAAGAIDLKTQLPAGLTNFQLSVYVLDFGSVGSTTEIWLEPIH